jgi:O-antigen ligase
VADLEAAGVTPGVAPWSLDPRATERILWSTLVPIGVFLAAATLRTGQRRKLIGLVLGFAAASTVLGLWQLMSGPNSNLYLYEITNRGSAVGFFANRNHLAGLLAASLPVAAGLLADRLRHHRHGARDFRVWLLTGLLVVLAVGVTATSSRAGFVLMMLSVVASAFVMWRAGRDSQWGRARPWLRVSGVIAGILIVQYTLYALLLRLEQDPLEDYRWEITPRTLEAAAPAAGLGFGFGTFRQAYDEIGDAAANMPVFVNHAHNDYAELWLEGGAPALLLVAGALALLVLALRRRLTVAPDVHTSETHDRGLALGAGLGLLLIAAHSAVDYPLRTLTTATFAALLAAELLGSVRAKSGRSGGQDGRPAATDLIRVVRETVHRPVQER